MKALAFGVGLLLASSVGAVAQYGGYGTKNSPYSYGTGSNPSSHYVSPYTTRSGTYVGGHYQTSPNSTTLDNYSTRGNVNPYTGSIGTRRPGW